MPLHEGYEDPVGSGRGGIKGPSPSDLLMQDATIDYESHMRRAVELAGSVGRTSPNPPVGALVIQNGEVVAEGFHRGAGTEHAEAAALRRAGPLARGATLVVTLEPCNHFGRTPPCTNAIIEAGVARVIYGSRDPNPAVHGGGHEALEKAGVVVESGLLRNETDRLTRFFRRHAMSGMPWVIGKVASSLDGRVATHTGQSRWITGKEARQRGHELRGMVDAILVGSGTVLADDPALTVRLSAGPTAGSRVGNPVRVVLDSHGRIPMDSRVFTTPDEAPTRCFSVALSEDRRFRLDALGVGVHIVPPDAHGRVALPSVLRMLGGMNVQSLLVEGGAAVMGSFHDLDLLDEVWAFISPRFIGGVAALGSVGGVGRKALSDTELLTEIEIEPCPPDFLIRGFVARSGHGASSRNGVETVGDTLIERPDS